LRKYKFHARCWESESSRILSSKSTGCTLAFSFYYSSTKTSRDSSEQVKVKVVSVKDRRNNKSDQTTYGSCDARYETVREMLALPVVCVVVLSENRPIVHRRTENAVSAYVRWNILRIIGYYVLVLRYALSIETILKCISMITIGIHARTLREGRRYACARIVSTRKINELFSRINLYRSYSCIPILETRGSIISSLGA